MRRGGNHPKANVTGHKQALLGGMAEHDVRDHLWHAVPVPGRGASHLDLPRDNAEEALGRHLVMQGLIMASKGKQLGVHGGGSSVGEGKAGTDAGNVVKDPILQQSLFFGPDRSEEHSLLDIRMDIDKPHQVAPELEHLEAEALAGMQAMVLKLMFFKKATHALVPSKDLQPRGAIVATGRDRPPGIAEEDPQVHLEEVLLRREAIEGRLPDPKNKAVFVLTLNKGVRCTNGNFRLRFASREDTGK
jgi:hypothetical protein